jgi:hypothetical protein
VHVGEQTGGDDAVPEDVPVDGILLEDERAEKLSPAQGGPEQRPRRGAPEVLTILAQDASGETGKENDKISEAAGRHVTS